MKLKRLAVSILALGLAGPVLANQSDKVFGWVEEGSIQPEGISVKIKLDTGAKTSSMDAKDLERFSKDGDKWVRFNVELEDTDTGKMKSMKVERKIVRNIKVRGAGGAESRPVVMMSMCIGDQVYKEQFSLKNRSKMNYPVLIGRSTIKDLGLVDVSKTFTSEPNCKK
ncbi:retropepsin-like aspartic peptidase RloA3 [Pseudomonas sp. EL_65y_Pfl2_R95]|uniref:retropepsin-like aspartic peptidase RloA3 n=1 Tax=Pseudomonas sp. EL_65y_Pfl2_R95 TaxID=3088698 RepID=UPI0030DA00F8